MKLSSDPENEFSDITLGTGTRIYSQNGIVVLEATANDLVILSESDGELSIIVNNSEVVQLSRSESLSFVVRGDASSVAADNSIMIPIKGLHQRPPDHPKSTSKSAGFVFRGLYRKWELNNTLSLPELKKKKKSLKNE